MGKTFVQEKEVLKLALRVFVFAVVMTPLASWGVTNAIVGTCDTGTQFTTIQSAVDAASASSTVRVCPGTYPEQITISKSLTLTGLSLGRSATIVPPSGGWIGNGYFGNNPFVAQVLVQHATVTINNIGVDANSEGGQCFASGRWIGIAYQAASGTIKNSVVRGGPLCGDSTAILADATPRLTISNNSIHGCVDCIDIVGATNTSVTSNTIIQGVVSYFGVKVQNSPGPTTISSNTIIGIETGIYILNSGSVSVTSNTITTNAYAIGIQLIGASNHVVRNNRISNASQAIALDDTGATGTNSITYNTINDASCGISVGPRLSTTESLSPNTFYVVGGWYCP
jgi:parallel beta-helix repeat protein